MTVLSFHGGDLFTVRVTKYLSTNPDNKWANSYEFQASGDGAEDDLLALGTALTEFEANFHHDVVVFDRLLISTWQPDSVPYDPSTFISTTLTLSGGIGPVGDLLSLDQCLSVTRQARSGRFGHIFYRGCLEEPEVSARAGKTILVSRSAQQTKIDGSLSDSGLGDYIGSPAAAAFGMVMVNADGTQVRPVTALFVQGVSKVPADHAWFNRRSTP